MAAKSSKNMSVIKLPNFPESYRNVPDLTTAQRDFVIAKQTNNAKEAARRLKSLLTK
jgi:hypothetical protein